MATDTKDTEPMFTDVHIEQLRTQSSGEQTGDVEVHDATVYRTYKRRWFGLLQLVLLNIIVSWDVSLSTCLHLPTLTDSVVAHLLSCR